MKSRFLMCFTAITLFAALGMPPRLAAQDNRDHHHKHHHYQVIDIGTFGGPSSYFDNLGLSDALGFVPFIFEIAPVLNKQGVLAGWADTSTPDPYAPLCFNPDCFVSHAFQWHEGAKADLGVLPGGASSAALWINSKGLTVGMSQNGVIDPVTGYPELHGVVWRNGQISDLGTFGGNVSYASTVNNRGQVAGTAQNAVPDQFSFFDLLFVPNGSSNGTQTRAFLWDAEHGMQDLGTLGGPDASASLVNEHGQVAGASYTNDIPNATTGLPTFHPFLWDKEKGMQDLGSLGGTALGSVNGINERGQVVGGTTTAGDVYVNPFLWDGTKMINLIAPPFVGIPSGEAQWINEAGEVVGGAAIPGPCSEFNFHAFLWEKGAITDLGLIAAGIPNSSASFINSKTQVVGVSVPCDFSSSTAFLWEKGSMADLNTLIPPNSPFQLFSASFIDDHGVIGAFGALANGDMHALLLTPCDEHHPGLEGCDYSMVDAPVAPRVSPAPASQHPAALTPGGRLPVGMLNRFRFPWSQRNPTAGAAPAPDQERELPADGVGEHKMPDSLVEPPLWPPAGHCVGTSKLTGYCVIETPYGCFDKHDPQACPPGAKVKKPGRQFCCIHGNCGHANVDLARRCG